MYRLIKNLQNKSDGFKRIIMWFGVLVIMTTIFMFWLLTFPSRVPVSENNETAADLSKQLPGVWQSLKEQINNLKDLWQK
ncbi:hypothetical protein A2819_02050 [Candidatus Azambacteria bacterium RIFCSPHIGHO2_01_FULL_40_24]|uniref:Uncharacterized protein n=1 Tax=Candidatus Azambacteria bacterium RIFCSPHIGHO2_01_FULL_40_24 TaxID=1797301 RepID=A0A1F5B4I1_9BACT|nr:MAG: hypothetical protein A2819_02050 [Candidatus Azambacteria bacterium RIFCSPHIGHO2_01_FULL_40_24]